MAVVMAEGNVTRNGGEGGVEDEDAVAGHEQHAGQQHLGGPASEVRLIFTFRRLGVDHRGIPPSHRGQRRQPFPNLLRPIWLGSVAHIDGNGEPW